MVRCAVCQRSGDGRNGDDSEPHSFRLADVRVVERYAIRDSKAPISPGCRYREMGSGGKYVREVVQQEGGLMREDADVLGPEPDGDEILLLARREVLEAVDPSPDAEDLPAAFSRKVVGWSLGDKLDADLSAEALRRAVTARRPEPGLIFHSDRGSEFAAGSFRDVLTRAGAIQSMSRKGNCWDNAAAESFFSTLEFEGPRSHLWRSAPEALPSLFTFIEAYYNARRLHSTNCYRSPNTTEADWRMTALAA